MKDVSFYCDTVQRIAVPQCTFILQYYQRSVGWLYNAHSFAPILQNLFASNWQHLDQCYFSKTRPQKSLLGGNYAVYIL